MSVPNMSELLAWLETIGDKNNCRKIKEETEKFFGLSLNQYHKTVGKKVLQIKSDHKIFKRNLERTIAEEQGGKKMEILLTILMLLHIVKSP